MREFKGNKGEWSELYVFFKLLADKKLYGADSDTNILSEIYYDILSIYRYENEGKYSYSPKPENIIQVRLNNKIILKESTEKFIESARILLNEIKSHSGGTIRIPRIEAFAKSIALKGISASSNKKADIHLKTYDYRTGFTPKLSFSIKSQLGSPATLLNASRATNFRYKLIGDVSEDCKKKFNEESKFFNKFKVLKDYALQLDFDSILNETFNNNLTLIDSDLPKILAVYLVKSFEVSENKIEKLTPIISNLNPLGVNHSNLELYYSYKWKEFLTSVALGVLPSTEWNGDFEATGGYIIVKEEGEIVCYHIYNRNEFREYLYKNIRFENGSTSRHKFGKIYEENGNNYLNLNLQLRFLR